MRKIIICLLMFIVILSISVTAFAASLECNIDKLVSDDGYQSFIKYEPKTRKNNCNKIDWKIIY